MNKTIKKKLTFLALLLMSFCFINPGYPNQHDSSNYSIEKHIKHVNAGDSGVKGGYFSPCDLRIVEDAALFGEKGYINKLGETRYSDTSSGIDVI